MAPGSVLPAAPVRLRYQVTGLPAGNLAGALDPPGAGGQVKVIDAATAELALDQPPPRLRVHGQALGSDPDGLTLGLVEATLYFGGEPRLVRLDKTGKATEIGPAPADVFGGMLGPDGRYAALDVQGWEAGGLWISDLKSGQLWQTPAHWSGNLLPVWLPDGRLLAAAGHTIWLLDPATRQAVTERSQGNSWVAVSPDGRYLAGHTGGDPYVSRGVWVPPRPTGSLVIRDLLKDTEVSYPWEGYAAYGDYDLVSWLPDGSLVVAVTEGDLSNGPEGAHTAFVRLDPATGQRAPYPGRPGPASPQHWVFGAYGEPGPIAGGLQRQVPPDVLPFALLPGDDLLAVRWPNHGLGAPQGV